MNTDGLVILRISFLLRVAAISALPFARAQAQEHEHLAPQSERLGTVHFATSCSPSVAPQFNRAVALLHSFEFGASTKAFNDILAVDSTCAMAYWGLAMNRWSNPMAAGNRPVTLLTQGRNSANAAKRLGQLLPERERLYIAAVGELYNDFEHRDQRARQVAYENAMRTLVTKEPADTEAIIFHALALAAAADPADKTYRNQLEAGRILEQLFAKQPNHPGLAHYIIHTYDYPPLAARATHAAELYATIAPSAAHALHMPSHTFTRVGMWRASVETNKRSIDVAMKSGAIAEVLHATDYAEYALLQMRMLDEAKDLVTRVPGLAARFDPNVVTGAAPPSAGVFALAAIPARYAVERKAWREAAALEPMHSDYPWAEAMTYFTRGLGASHTGLPSEARVAIDSLGAIHERLVRANEPYWAEQVAIQQLASQAWLEYAENRRTDALVHMREAAKREDATEKNAVTPGPLAPARELLGDMLMQMSRPAEARAEYEAELIREPNRYHALDGARRAALATGDKKAAQRYAIQIKHLTAR